MALAGAFGDTAHAADNETLYIGGGGGGAGATSSLIGSGGDGGPGGGSGGASSSQQGGGGGGGGIGVTTPLGDNGAHGSAGGAGGSGNSVSIGASSEVGNGGAGGAGSANPSNGGNGGGSSGAGGDGGSVSTNSGAGGGGGGGAWWENAGDIAYDSIEVGGGSGGRGVFASNMQGSGGGGGGAKLTANEVIVTNTLSIRGGHGGRGDFYGNPGGGGTEGGGGKSSDNGGGGSGGGAMLTADSITVTTGSLDLISGDRNNTNNNTGRGHGGEARLIVTGTVKAPSINLTKNDGALVATIGTLDASGDTTLNLSGTTAGTSTNNSGVYIGTARLGDGALQINGSSSGIAAIGVLRLEGRGTFADTSSSASVGSLSIDGGTLHNGNWNGLIDHAYTTQAITLGSGGATVDLGAGQDETLSRALTGGGSLTKTGEGVLTLTGANTYSGGTTVNAGTLNIAADNNIGTGTNTLSGGTLQLTGTAYTKNWALGAGSNTIETPNDVTYAGVLSGTGFTKTGAGKLTLSGANTFTGALAVNTGTVKLDTSATLAASSLSLGEGAVFDYSTATAYASSSPGAFQAVTVGGLGAKINAGAGRTADFSGGTLHFIIPKNAVADSVLLNVNGHATVAGATVNLTTPDGRPKINIGDKLILIDATEGVDGAPATTTQTAGGDTYSVKVDGNELQAVLEALSPTSPVVPIDPGTPGVPGAPGGFSSLRLKAYAEGRAAGLAFVSQGLDFILNRGLGSAIAATEGPGLRVNAFGGTGGGDSRYRSGSHVDVRGMSFLAGLAVGNGAANGRATAAAFFEGGWGNYDSHNSFSKAASVDGKGGTSYTGGGILGRYDVTRGMFAGLYLDASARMGRTRTDFRTADIQYNGWKANFDSSSLYYGLHAGLGYARALTDKAVLDLSAKMLWTRQKGDNVTVYRDDVRFEDADSLRTRLGGRFAYAVNDRVTPYAGAYWEHEFAGRLRSTVNGERLAPPSLRGDSGMGEVGFTYHPPGGLGLTVDIGVQGYAGKRRGASGSVRVGWTF